MRMKKRDGIGDSVRKSEREWGCSCMSLDLTMLGKYRSAPHPLGQNKPQWISERLMRIQVTRVDWTYQSALYWRGLLLANRACLRKSRFTVWVLVHTWSHARMQRHKHGKPCAHTLTQACKYADIRANACCQNADIATIYGVWKGRAIIYDPMRFAKMDRRSSIWYREMACKRNLIGFQWKKTKVKIITRSSALKI